MELSEEEKKAILKGTKLSVDNCICNKIEGVYLNKDACIVLNDLIEKIHEFIGDEENEPR